MPGLRVNARVEIPLRELRVRTARSGGPGGQHVNKVETKVEVVFDVASSSALDSATKVRLLSYLESMGVTDGCFRATSQESRSQWKNRQSAFEKLGQRIREVLRPVRTRTATRPTAQSRLRRLEEKKRRSQVKRMRRPDGRETNSD